MERAGENIDRLITIDVRRRPIPTLITPKIYEAARRKIGKPLTLSAAKALMDTIHPGDKVIISTGFMVPGIHPHGEVCGVIGAVVLARAIKLGLNATVLLLSEEPIIPVLDAACRAAGLQRMEIEILKEVPKEVRAVAIQSFPTDVEEAKVEARRLIDDLAPSAIITIQKAGRNENGIYLTAHGNDISESTAKIDCLVDEANKRGILTIGIGDLGQEIGMGIIRDTVRKVVPHGPEIATVVKTDYLVIGLSSNVATFGVEACLSGLLEKPELLHDGETLRRVFEASIRAGAVDGSLVAPTLTDHGGIPADFYVHIVEVLRTIVQLSLMPQLTIRSSWEKSLFGLSD